MMDRKYHFQSNEPAMQRVLKQAQSVASSRAPILLSGPSGVGKEVLARYIHQHGVRSEGPFVAVNCAALPENLLESELFGYEKGAFTGAHQRKLGKFELAQGGTFLLDEVSEMPMHLQAKLLRVLQEQELDRLGGAKPVALNVRVIATANCDLEERVNEGRFRQDLYYRLNVLNFKIPPLSERVRDLNHLVPFFLSKLALDNGVTAKRLSREAMNKICSWTWPGNIRELENVLERALLLSEGNILEASDIEITMNENQSAEKLTPGMKLAEAEQKLIFKTLEFTRENRTKAADLLGISVRTLRNKLNTYKTMNSPVSISKVVNV